MSPFRVSPLGVVPKKTLGEYRLIHHLSFPKGSSVNDGISSEHRSVKYATIDKAIEFIKKAGQGCFMAKTDIKNSFRIIPICPEDYGLLGMQWQDLYYYDRCMPMGCSSSCLTFETFSTAVEWIAHGKLNISYIFHLLDDFPLIAPSMQLYQMQLDLFLSLCSYLGFLMAPEETFSPVITLSFAGTELDSVLPEARLPCNKLAKCRSLISKEVQSGLFNFACSVVRPGRAFLIDRTIGIRSRELRIRLNKKVKKDLKLLSLSFLSNFNGRSLIFS